MIYAFDAFELGTGQVELRRNGAPVPVEPQVFFLLTLLVENGERVSRDEIVEKVWDGRIVSEAAVSSRIKSARRALGDDGSSQRLIRTVHGRGLRFVARPLRPAATRSRLLPPGAKRAPRRWTAAGLRSPSCRSG